MAEKLHKFLWEVEEQMSLDELTMWTAWFEYKAQKEKEGLSRAERMSRSKRGSK